MKKIVAIVFLFFVALNLMAQSTIHYKIGTSQVDIVTALDALNQLEANFNLYQQWLGKTPSNLPLFNVNFYRNNASFNDALLPQKLPGVRTDFIYLYYNNSDKNVLYIYPMEARDAQNRLLGADNLLSRRAMTQSLNRHGFLQYLFAVAPTSPAWFREGSALYFEAINHPSDGSSPSVIMNRDYLFNLKNWNTKDSITLSQLLMLNDDDFVKDAERNLVFSWGFINFLTNTGRTALLTQLAAAIDPSASQQANSAAMKAIIDGQNLQSIFTDYINNTKTFSELMELGSDAYNAGDNEQAKKYFMEATLARGDLFSAYYYLGLISYDDGRYDDAKGYYAAALANGASEALINYNLAFIAFKEGDYDLAVELLTMAKIADYPKFGVGSDRLLSVIPTERAIKALAVSPLSANGSATVTVVQGGERNILAEPAMINAK